jgi:hypothetical protein
MGQCLFLSQHSARTNRITPALPADCLKSSVALALFIRRIIRTFQLIYSAGTVFFSHNKSANSVFQPAYQHSGTRMETVPSIFSLLLARLCTILNAKGRCTRMETVPPIESASYDYKC